MNKQKELDTIAKEIERCKLCKIGATGKAVPGEGNPDAIVVFIGEAPGKTEAATGRPFVGRSGKFLRKSIQELGLKEMDVFITSPVKYLPDRNPATPTKAEIAHGQTHFFKQLAIIDPKIVVLMGATATQAVLNEKIPVMQRHGTTLTKNDKTYFLTLHPAAAIRFERFRKIFKTDFDILKSLLEE